MIALAITNAMTFVAFVWVCSMYRKDLQRMAEHHASQAGAPPVFIDRLEPVGTTYVDEVREVELQRPRTTKVSYDDEA